jgi:4-amino-4-deoxy-L-arabinose transferase-like glycosyltransferase
MDMTHSPAPDARAAHRNAAGIGWPLLILAVACFALFVGWVGYSASDDAAYYEGALKWLTHPPAAGDDHWATRFPLILSLTAVIAVLGKGFAAMSVTALLWYAIFLATVRALAMRIAGERAGWIAMLLMAAMPVVVTNASTVSCDLTEATFLLLGVLLISDQAVAARPAPWRPIAAGLAFGCAILCRETTSLALFGFVPLFLTGRPVRRGDLILMGAACAVLLGAEAAFQWALTGDPLHRWTLAFHHDSHIDRAANLEGNFLLWAPIDPLLVLLVNDDFALIFWLAAAAVAMRFDRGLDATGRRRMMILAALAFSTFLLVGALYTKLVLNPRYFMLPTIAATIAVAAWLDRLEWRARTLLLVAALGADLLMLSVENLHPRWPAEALAAAAAEHPGEAIRADFETHRRAKYRLEWQGLTNVVTGAPQPGALSVLPETDLPAGAAVLARYPSPPTRLGAVVEGLGLAGHVPGGIARRLLHPNPTMVLTRPVHM